MHAQICYDFKTRAFHWLTVLLFVAAIVLVKLYEHFEDDDVGLLLIIGHKAMGAAILFVSILRLINSKSITKLNLAANGFLNQLATVVHKVLYLLLIAVPVLGVLSQVFDLPGFDVIFYGLDEDFFEDAHENFAKLFIMLVALHSMAALFHGFIKKDKVLYSMLPIKSLDR